MCGIVGIVPNDSSAPVALEKLLGMRDSLIHRGPDDAGYYLQPGIGLGSRRLSIIDLSEHGHMPMSTVNKRYWIVYNGEVYNFGQLREQLIAQNVEFRSATDTEVLLYLYAAEGPAMLEKLNGMFAIAIWDTQEKKLFAARDRMGIKPFYYAIQDGCLYFASEQKALFAAGIHCEFDETTWPELLFFRYIAGERTPYRGVNRLLPGYYLEVQSGRVELKRWWALSDVIQPQRLHYDPEEFAEQYATMFDNSIGYRRISDVPIGALLSGGVDSGAIAATMGMQTGGGVETFTMRFNETAYDEGELARQVARRWQLKSHELFLPAEQIPAMLEDATWLLDEPVAHGNDLHLLAIARYAKPLVTVLLSGEGADEVFGGYVRYRAFRYAALFDLLRPGLNLVKSYPALSRRLDKTAKLFTLKTWSERVLFSSADLYFSNWNLHTNWREALPYHNHLIEEACQVYREPVRQVMFYDQHTYLQSILDRNDRMTMGASIECREPYLDVNLVEWAANLPTDALFLHWTGKKVIRQAMQDRLPESILRHKKWGFGVPWVHYLRRVPALRSWIQGLHSHIAIQSCPIPLTQVEELARRFLAGDDSQADIIRLLVFVSVWYSVCVQGQPRVLSS